MTWREVSLKEICKVDWGNTRLTKSSYIDDGKFLAVSAAGADGLINHYEHEANVPVLSAIGAQCGRMFYPGARFTAIKNTITLTPKEGISDGKFLYYLFTHVELPQRGAGQPFISKGDIEAFRVSIPESMDEQCEMVVKLDKAFAEINELEGNLGLCDQKANQLLESLLSSAFLSAKGEIDDVLPLSDFNNIFTVIPDSKSKIKSSSYLESGKYAVVDQGKQLISGYTNSSSTVDSNMLPVIVFGDHTRAVKYINFPFTAGADGTQILKPSSSANPRFCFYLVLHAVGQIPSKGYARHFGELKKREFHFPDIAIQNRVVEKLDATFAEIESFKAQVARRQNAVSDLRQSLLSHAFNQALGVS